MPSKGAFCSNTLRSAQSFAQSAMNRSIAQLNAWSHYCELGCVMHLIWILWHFILGYPVRRAKFYSHLNHHTVRHATHATAQSMFTSLPLYTYVSDAAQVSALAVSVAWCQGVPMLCHIRQSFVVRCAPRCKGHVVNMLQHLVIVHQLRVQRDSCPG